MPEELDIVIGVTTKILHRLKSTQIKLSYIELR